ncbi:MAG: gliding motility-associated C-terminal domain-containing protein, partial [Paludibacteraceae bacterium]|nr:gliding motility-associated C-terminal domain-containing protein [Paludibacteraceae bacterium]
EIIDTTDNCSIEANEIVSVPKAAIPCELDSVSGVGYRKSGKALTDPFEIGNDTIVWKFFHELLTDTVTCEQPVTIISKQAPIFECSSLDEIIDTTDDCNIEATEIVNVPSAELPCGLGSVNGVGSRKSGLAMSEPFAIGNDTIVWKFFHEFLTDTITCEQPVTILSSQAPIFECSSLDEIIDTTDECNIEATEIVSTPTATLPCGLGSVNGVGSRKSGLAMSEPFATGNDTIVWKFFHEFLTDTITCEQPVTILSSQAPIFECSSLDEIIDTTDECNIEATEIVNVPTATLPCGLGSVNGVGARKSGLAMTDPFEIGNDTIVWKFFHDFLTDTITCEQPVTILSSQTPIFECKNLNDTTIALAFDECQLAPGKLNLVTPIAKDACTEEEIIGIPYRSDSLSINDSYPIGETTIEWIFISKYSTTSHSCYQKVTVIDTAAPMPNCDALDTIFVKISKDSEYTDAVTIQEAKAAGLTISVISDICEDSIIGVPIRNDGKEFEANYPLGNTSITWSYTDKYGNKATCEQVVVVEDWIIDTLYCPGKLDGKTYSCIDEVPEPYKNIEEFFENGGSFSNLMKLNKNSFTSNDSIEGDSCEMILKRTYAVNDIRGNRIICQEFMSIKDDIAPTILTDLRDTMISCESEIFAALEIEVADNCDNAPKIEVKESNNRSENSLSCEYYNYDITRIYTITDRCNNVVRDTQLIQVRDTIGPKFDFPDNWGDSVLAESMKGCLFKMPDFTNQVKAFVKDNCSGNDSVKIVQVPTSESPITSSLWVTIYAYDMCGNVDSTFKFVEVKNSKTIANIIAYNIDTCINETKGIVLNKQDIRYASGYYEQYDKRTGLYYQIPSSFCYDYYRGSSVVEDSLIFSSNPKTYRNKFEELLAIYETYSDMEDAMTKLIKRSESGYYTFVAMDTLTGCTDTATSYINIKERPKVALKQSELIACENNLIDLDNYIACIDDMGGEISNSYWTKNDELFEYHDSVKGIVKYDDNNAKLLFYIENECGTTVSSKSRKLFCGESDSLSYEDTLRLLNNDLVALELLRMNELYTNDSIILDIHKRYSPNEIIIETNLGDPARIWVGEDIELSVKTDYDFNTLVWYEVKGKFDRDSFDSQNNLDEFVFDDLDDEEDMIVDITYGNGNNSISVTPNDTTLYYVTLSDNICPAIPSDLIQVNVLKQLPSAFTPHFLDGYNDTFMPNHQVMIFDRYGDKIFEGNDGWDGTFKGRRVDPAVYFYSVIMRNGTVIKGTIEVVKID